MGDFIRIRVLDKLTPEIARWVAATPGAARRALHVSIRLVELAAKKNVSGRFLNIRSGKLLRSFRTWQNQIGVGRFIGVVAVGGGDVPYAAIHEEGGVIPAHTVYPRRAKVLRFEVGGKAVFSAYARIPAIRMRARRYLQTAVEENDRLIMAAFETEWIAALRGVRRPAP